jgi:hypothetical protein
MTPSDVVLSADKLLECLWVGCEFVDWKVGVTEVGSEARKEDMDKTGVSFAVLGSFSEGRKQRGLPFASCGSLTLEDVVVCVATRWAAGVESRGALCQDGARREEPET